MTNKHSNRLPMPTANKTATLACLVFGTTTYVSLAAYGAYRYGVSLRLACLFLVSVPGFVCVWAKHFGWRPKRTPPKAETKLYLDTLTADPKYNPCSTSNR